MIKHFISRTQNDFLKQFFDVKTNPNEKAGYFYRLQDWIIKILFWTTFNFLKTFFVFIICWSCIKYLVLFGLVRHDKLQS